MNRPPNRGRAKIPAPSAPMDEAEARWRSEERYRSIFNAMTEGMVLQTAEGTIIDCNDQAVRILGQTRNQILGRTSRDPHWRAVREDGSPFPGEEHPAMVALKTGQPCRQTVMGLQLPQGALRWISINAEPLFWNGNSKPTAVVATFSDITERKRIEASLQESNALFSLFMRHSPIFAYIKEITPDASRVLFASDNFREMVGIPGSAMRGKTMAELFPAEFAAKITRDDQAVMAKGEVLEVDEELNGRHYATVKFPIIQGGRSLLAGYTLDITERRQAEAEREQFSMLFNLSTDLMVLADPQGCFLRVNPAARRLLGYSEAELLKKPFLSFVHPDDRQATREEVARQMQTGTSINFINRYLCKDRSVRWLSWHANYIAADGTTYATARDITEQRQADDALRKSEEKFRAIANFSPDIISIFDREGRLIFNSAAAVKIHGYPAGELENRSTFDFIHPDDRPGVTAAFGRLLSDQAEEVKIQYRYRNADGSYKWMEALGRNELSNPLIKGIIAISRDISERKLAEEKLRKSAQFIAETGKIGKVGGWEFNIETGKQTWTAAVHDIHEVDLSFEPTVEKGIQFYTPASRPVVERAVKEAIEQGKPFDLELEITTAKGNRRWVKAIGKPDPEHCRIFGFFQDITERKQAELALRQLNETLEQRVGERTAALQESKERFRAIATNTPDYILIQDRKLRYQLVINPQLGLTEADMIGKTDRDLFKPADAARLTALKKRVLKTGKPVRLDTPFPNLKGELEYFEGVYTPKRDATGKTDGLIGYFHNVTQRKRTEEALRESERLHRLLFTNLQDALVTVEAPAWKIVVANPAAVKMFRARNIEQLLAAKPWELSPELQPDGRPSLQAARAVIEIAMERGSHSFEWRHRRLNGEEFPASVLLARVEVAGRTLVQGTVRDFTERVRLEQEILNISDWERRRITQDLHDGLGQLLVGAGYLADTLRKDMAAKAEHWAPRLNRIQEAINEAGKQARDVARGVQPVEPEPNGLMTALAKLAQQTSEVFGTRCDFKCHPPVSIEDRQTGTHLFRIAQESVTNAIKHGKAKRISLRLTRKPRQIILTIKDDGAGLTRSRLKKGGMGLRIMHYRAGIIGGTLTVQNKSDTGTTVTCHVPIPNGNHRQAKGEKD
ncbi:MAG: PAS domain S-box protein [Verrucomicrobiota bacterium]